MNESINNQNNNFQMGQNIRERERKAKGLMALVIILLIIVLGLSGYIYYDKFLAKEDNQNEQNNNEDSDVEENVVKALDVNSTLVKNLYNVIDGLQLFGAPSFHLKKIVLPNDFKNNEKLNIAFRSMNKTNNCDQEISVSLLESLMNKILGNVDVEYTNSILFTPINGSICTYELDSTKSKYTKVPNSGVGGAGLISLHDIAKATSINNKRIEIYDRFLRIDENYDYITGAESTQKILNKNECTALDSDCFNHFYDQLYYVKLTFELNDDGNSYHFVSSEVVYE